MRNVKLGLRPKSKWILLSSFFTLHLIVTCTNYKLSIHFWPDLVLNQIAILIPIKAPKPKIYGVKQGLLNKWKGMKASKAATVQVDGVTGATFSSKAVKENVKRGIAYYQKHK